MTFVIFWRNKSPPTKKTLSIWSRTQTSPVSESPSTGKWEQTNLFAKNEILFSLRQKSPLREEANLANFSMKGTDLQNCKWTNQMGTWQNTLKKNDLQNRNFCLLHQLVWSNDDFNDISQKFRGKKQIIPFKQDQRKAKWIQMDWKQRKQRTKAI